MPFKLNMDEHGRAGYIGYILLLSRDIGSRLKRGYAMGATHIAGAKTAKLFLNGRSQAVRLPMEFRFETDEVFIRRDASTGDVILSTTPGGDWRAFKQLREQLGSAPEDFLADRAQGSEGRDPLADWQE